MQAKEERGKSRSSLKHKPRQNLDITEMQFDLFLSESSKLSRDIEKDLSSNDAHEQSLISSEQKKHIVQNVERYLKKGVPEWICQTWLVAIPTILEMSHLLIDPDQNFRANVRMIRQLYHESCKRAGEQPLQDYNFNDNIVDCAAILLGFPPYDGSENLLKQLKKGQRANLHLPANIISKNEVYHCLEMILHWCWYKRCKEWRGQKYIIDMLFEQMYFLYSDKSRSELLAYCYLEGMSVERLSEYERTSYYTVFNSPTSLLFFKYTKEQIKKLKAMRLYSARRIERFFARDKRWQRSLSDQLELVQERYRRLSTRSPLEDID